MPVPQNCTLSGENGTIDGADISDVLVTLTDKWSHPTDLSDNISPNGMSAYAPKVAMDDNGNAIIVWYQYDVGRNQIFMSEFC